MRKSLATALYNARRGTFWEGALEWNHEHRTYVALHALILREVAFVVAYEIQLIQDTRWLPSEVQMLPVTCVPGQKDRYRWIRRHIQSFWLFTPSWPGQNYYDDQPQRHGGTDAELTIPSMTTNRGFALPDCRYNPSLQKSRRLQATIFVQKEVRESRVRKNAHRPFST